MTTVTFTLPSVASVTSADWGAVFHRWAKAAAAVLVVPYVAGLMAGDAWRRLVAWANAHHLAGLARLGLPGATADHFPAATEMVSSLVADALDFMEEYDDVFQALADAEPGPPPARVQRLAPASLPTIAAPPLESLTVAQLRQMARAAGHRKIARSGRRAELLQVLAG